MDEITCPKCQYKRREGDSAHIGVCPQCGVAYNKCNNTSGYVSSEPDHDEASEAVGNDEHPLKVFASWLLLAIVLMVFAVAATAVIHRRAFFEGMSNISKFQFGGFESLVVLIVAALVLYIYVNMAMKKAGVEYAFYKDPLGITALALIVLVIFALTVLVGLKQCSSSGGRSSGERHISSEKKRAIEQCMQRGRSKSECKIIVKQAEKLLRLQECLNQGGCR